LHRISSSQKKAFPLLLLIAGTCRGQLACSHHLPRVAHSISGYGLGRTLGLRTSARGLWGRPWASAEVGKHQPSPAKQLWLQSNYPPKLGLNPREWDESQGNQ